MPKRGEREMKAILLVMIAFGFSFNAMAIEKKNLDIDFNHKIEVASEKEELVAEQLGTLYTENEIIENSDSSKEVINFLQSELEAKKSNYEARR